MSVCEFLTVGSLEKVGSSARPELIERENVMLQNETLSFQIAMMCREFDRRFCHVKVSGDIAAFTEIRYADLVPSFMSAKYDCDDYYITKEPSVQPDVLRPLPEEGFYIFHKQCRALWQQSACCCRIMSEKRCLTCGGARCAAYGRAKAAELPQSKKAI